MTRHSFDPISFVAGLVFAGLGVAFMIGNVTLPEFDWLWPLIAVALGVAIFASTRRSEQSVERHDESTEGTTSVS
jgi:hypothetical protein